MPAAEHARILTQLDNRLQRLGLSKDTRNHVDAFKIKILQESGWNIKQQKRVMDALGLMAEVHSDQKPRPDGTPYVEHPLDVADRAFEYMEVKDADIVVAALLHDSVEDQAPKLAAKARPSLRRKTEQQRALDYIDGRFGHRVGKIVHGVTNPDFDAILTREGLIPDTPEYKARKNILYRDHVEEAIEDKDIVLAKYFDFSANAFGLENLKDEAKRAKLVKKYYPVVGVFITRLTRATDLNIKPELRDKMVADLYTAQDKLRQMLQSS